jgi:hypothetical protein
MLETDSKALLALALFRVDPRSSKCRETLYRSMVEFALFLSGCALSSAQIREKVLDTLEQPTGISQEECDAAIQECLKLGTIVSADQGYKISSGQEETLTQQYKTYAQDERSFDEALAQCVEEELGTPLDDIAKTLLVSVLKTVVQRMFYEKSVELKRLARDSGSCEFGALLAAGSAYDPISALGHEIEPMVQLYAQNKKDDVMRGIRTFLASLSDAAKRYLSSLHHRVFYFQILNIDPALQEIQKQCFVKTRLYLDTNVVIPLLFDGHPSHQAICDVVAACVALEFQLFVSPATYDELVNKVSQAKSLVTVTGERGIPTLITDTLQGRASEPIISTFAIKKRLQPSLKWGAFITTYEDMETYLMHHNILVEKEEYESVRKEANYNRVWQTIRGIRRPEIPERIIDHDADNFVLIHKLRKIHADNPVIGPSVWLITSDHSLKESENRLINVYDTPHCQFIQEWGEFLLPFQNVGRFVFSDYVSYLVASKLGALIEEQTLDLNILKIICDSEFDLDDFLGLPVELQVKVLSGMQRDRSCQELQERARTAITLEEKTQVADDFRKKELELLVDEKALVDDQLMQLSEAVTQLRNELDRVRSSVGQKDKSLSDLTQRLQIAEAKLQHYESMSFWDRLKKVFQAK